MSTKVVIVVVLFAMAVGGSVALALMEGGIEYRTIPEMTSNRYDGERVKLRAQVVEMQQEYKPTMFTVIDIPPEGQQPNANARAIQVVYEGDDVPQGLKQAAHVTCEGRYDASRGAFVATLLQTQCPSRYQGQELTPANEAEIESSP